MISAFDTIFARYGSPPPTIRAIWDEALVLGGELRVRDGDGTIITRLNGDGIVDTDLSSVVETLVGLYVCKPEVEDPQDGALVTITAVLLRPRFWEWDRSAGAARPRSRDRIRVGRDHFPLACVFSVIPGLPAGTA